MLELEQLEEDENGSDVGVEEVQAELAWLQFEGQSFSCHGILSGIQD
jgi:hypothetical protein